jgi:hypothetical protein
MMNRRLCLGLALLLLAGCGQSYYKIPKEEFRQTVRTLGVLPLLVDENSTVLHPDRQAIFDLLRRENAGKEAPLVKMLRDEKAYFDVRAVAGDPGALFPLLVAGSTLRGQGADIVRRYRFNPAGVAEIVEGERVDGILVVIMNGVERPEKRWDRDQGSLSFLETVYNDILVYAAVLLPTGVVAWEYPVEGGGKFLNLQYPDFDGAFFNRTENVQVRPISLAGLGRTLSERDRGLFREEELPRRYKDLFEHFTQVLKPGLLSRMGLSDGGAR